MMAMRLFTRPYRSKSNGYLFSTGIAQPQNGLAGRLTEHGNVAMLFDAQPLRPNRYSTCMRSRLVLLTRMRNLLALLVLGFAATAAAASDPLFDAVATGNKTAVEQALAQGAMVDSRARDRATPLISAALDNQPAIAELLLSKGADVMARNSGGFTALHAAAYSGSLPIVKLLLDKGAVLEDAGNKAGVTPMMVAGEENHVEVAELLIARGADINHPEIHGYLPVTRALWKGNTDIVTLYKQHGVMCPPTKILGSEEWSRRCLEIGQ
jgi:ankyrin repeat protein